MRSYILLMIGFLLTNVVFANGFATLESSDLKIQTTQNNTPQETPRRVVWNGDPIKVSIPLRQEKRLIFSDQVSIKVSESLIKTGILRILNNNKSLYLTALKPFASTRLYITSQTTGQVIFIDLQTDETAGATSVEIILKSPNATENAGDEASFQSRGNQAQIPQDVSYVDLMRFAWQAMYAPKQFMDRSYGFSRAPMATTYFVSNLVYGDKVIAHPTASWSAGGLYVTVVTLVNKYTHLVRIDMHRDLCGDWQAALMYPRAELAAQGHRFKDSTTLFLVSKMPFGKAMEVCYGHA